MLLTWIIAIPAIAGLLAWAVSGRSQLACRWIALLACVVDLTLIIGIWLRHAAAGSPGGVILDQNDPWVPRLGISYHLATDGLSLLLVALTAVLGVVAVAVSWKEINERVGTFHLALMLLLSGILGVFLAFDLILFYFFWELMLVPMYFLIGIWGHERRVYAAVKFFIFTFLSGLFMFIAILGLYAANARATGVYTFSYPALLLTAKAAPYSLWLMMGFFVAFAVKLPMIGLHNWLPDAHTEAPTAGSVILAGLLLKTGAYGLIRFAIPLFPAASADIRLPAMILGAAGIIYGAVLAFAQRDFKRMVAYTSVSHMGFVLLGIYSGNQLALQGAVIQILSHGISTGALFALAGMLQERTHTRDFTKLGGLWATVPKMGGFTLLFAIAGLGLPGFGNFVGEFLVLLGAFQASPAIAIVASVGFVLSAIYSLRLVQMSMFGPNENNWAVKDLDIREIAVLGGLALVILWLGLHPQPVFNAAKPSVVAVQQSLGVNDEEMGARP